MKEKLQIHQANIKGVILMKLSFRLFCIILCFTLGMILACDLDSDNNSTEQDSPQKNTQDEKYFKVILEDGTKQQGITFKINDTNYDSYQMCIHEFENQTRKKTLYNKIVSYETLKNNEYTFNYPFVDVGKSYVCNMYFSKKNGDFYLSNNISVTVLTGFGESFLETKTSSSLEIDELGNLTINNLPIMNQLPCTTNNHYNLNITDSNKTLNKGFTIETSPSYVKNNTFSMNISKQLQSKDLRNIDCILNFWFEFIYNGQRYKVTFIDSKQFIWSPTDNENNNDKPTDPITPTETETSHVSTAKINQFFWGTWQCMANGNTFIIDENNVYVSNDTPEIETRIPFEASSSTSDQLFVETLGQFEKQSESVILNGAIPYFRKGGSNLEYTLKLVGFEDSIGRAASTPSTISGKKVKGTSVKYPSFVSEAESDEDGTIRGLRAPVAGDVQTITITDNDNTIVVVTGIKVENNGDNMGTIPLSKNGKYSLKVTGTIPEEEKDDGYMYGNNYKRYPMTLTITNISDVTSEPSIYQITPEDSRLSIRGDTEGRIGTLKKGATKTINLEVECGNLTEGYLDTGLNISIENTITEKSWDDYVPLRFYKGLMPLTIAAENVEGNNNSALNGFVIYPDGNSQFFAVPQGENKTLFLPTTIKDKVYKLAFSGATVEGNLSESTEMLYTVAINSPTKEPVDESTTAFKQSVRFGEEGNGNNTEDTAYEVTGNSFQAYLSDGEIDYYIINHEETDSVLPNYQDEQINHTNPYFEIIQEDGTTLSGLTFKIKNTNYHNYGFCIFPYKSGTKWENRLENSVMTHAETENNNFLYNFPFVDEGEKYICYVIFTKNGKDYNPYPEGITIRALSGLGETYFLNDKTPNIVISDSGNIVISDIPNKPSLPNITNDYYFIFVYTEYALKESDYIDNLTITYSPSSIINNTLTTNINDRINSKNWSKEDCLFNIGYDFWYNGYKYTITFIDKHSF